DQTCHRRRRRRIERFPGGKQVSERIPHRLENERGGVVLRPIEVLPGKLTGACRDTLVGPTLFEPPRVEAECVRARHSARTRQQIEVLTEDPAALPKACGMEEDVTPPVQLAEVDVNRRADAIPDERTAFFVAVDVPERIAYVLDIEANSTCQQTGPCSIPVAQEIAVQSLTRAMTVRTAECIFLCRRR